MNNKGKPLLMCLLPFRSAVFILAFVIGANVVGKEVDEISNWWSVVATVVNLLTIGIIVLLAKRSGQSFFELLNLKRGTSGKKKTALLAFAAAAVGMSGMYLSGLVFYGAIMPVVSVKIIAPVPVAIAVVNFVLLPATVSFAEDGLYLGCGVGQIQNKIAAVFIPAFFYALQHCFIPTIFDVRYMLYRFFSFLPLTIAFCIYFQKKKDPLAIIIGHSLLDLASASMILMTSVDGEIYTKWLEMAASAA
ncbi:MAG: hypothetical protein IJ740_04445 [Ruminococcus sp.]|nr:hypothetical protein [Ruminococcus sp.]